ncbi:MAG: HAMP domain-containing protein, partial [Desulfobacterales bacterium]|nr:HAMP domain-containing protein [Desulfobacterales bacterium]
SGHLRQFYLEQTKKSMEIQALLLEKQILPHLLPLDTGRIETLCNNAGISIDTRFTLILTSGKVVGDSLKHPSKMDNHRDRPEIIDAVAGYTGSSIRYSATLNKRMMYIAKPVKQNNAILAIIRTSIPVTAVDQAMKDIRRRIMAGGIIVAVLASLLCFYVSRRIIRPIEEMRQGADRFAKGALDYRLFQPRTLELAGLADAMNQMAKDLEDRMKAVISQRNEYEAVLTSMVEGVIAIDENEHVISVNRSAARILDIDPVVIKGRSIHDVIRNNDLHRFVAETLAKGSQIEGDVIIFRKKEQIINTQCIPLYDSIEKRIGMLVVLNDVTKIRHLEKVRQDFVANVSHEIRTPLTTIKGFVETILNNFDEDRTETQRFLNIALKHVDRLNAIVEDLLTLAKIEQKDETKEMNLSEICVGDVIETAIQVINSKAIDKSIQIDLSCDTDAIINIDVPLIEQALINLLDNAIKYSPENSRIQVQADLNDSDVHICITDEGMGISKEHLPRLFERFYRVDKARSRNLGGTGLGLAIVKHIIIAHSGRVSVKSSTGQGSAFSIYLQKNSEG